MGGKGGKWRGRGWEGREKTGGKRERWEFDPPIAKYCVGHCVVNRSGGQTSKSPEYKKKSKLEAL